jgi:hypothetical protein
MATVVGVTASQLAVAGRYDAARVLRSAIIPDSADEIVARIKNMDPATAKALLRSIYAASARRHRACRGDRARLRHLATTPDRSATRSVMRGVVLSS